MLKKNKEQGHDNMSDFIYFLFSLIDRGLINGGYTHVLCVSLGPRIRGTQVKSSVRMKKAQELSKWLILDNLIPKIESKAPN